MINELLQNQLGAGLIVRCELPLTTERSEPEPDIAIVKGTHADFRDRHPGGSDCCLVVEVADISLEKDRAKAAIYRSAGVQQYWIVNVAEQCLEQYCFDKSSLNDLATVITGDSRVSLRCGDREISLELKRIFE